MLGFILTPLLRDADEREKSLGPQMTTGLTPPLAR